ncbi:MAG TPA: response regulator transcription factor [Ferruginibacter sp.]|nr:response regulator transcription factor [Ferruginibacter sp.]HRN79427.1 response regulator transcription factor [Ferruginibacter sp.]HRN92217.1 response regulator transcription factor [Ferruginibacter sp.]HRO06374.1 response regulator transcription factor [Ferruginibacter sp.]HRO17369.1 response regulator transcription factor [Ferruginibacter sp.]
MVPNIIKVAIADDHKIFRKGVILSLRSYTNIKFVMEADNGEDLIAKIPESMPDVILCDLKMPVKDGIDATKVISREFPNIRVIILTMFEDDRFVGHLMDCGAAGYLLKSTDPAEIKRAIMDVMRTGFYLNPFVNRILIKKNYSKQKFNPSLTSEVVLSDREKEVLTLVCMEFTAQEIAAKMDISARTVEAIKDRLMERFGVKNSVGLVFYAMKNQLID